MKTRLESLMNSLEVQEAKISHLEILSSRVSVFRSFDNKKYDRFVVSQHFSRPRSSITFAANHFIMKPQIQFSSDRNFGLLVHGWNWHERAPRIVYPSSYKTALNASQCSINFDQESYFRNFRMNFPSLYLCLHSSHLRTATNLWT